MHRVPMIFPILFRMCALNLRLFNSFWIALLPPLFLHKSVCSEILGTKRVANSDRLPRRIPQ
jgi:hypothetical protein